MRLLLDTQIVQMIALDRSRLTAAERRILERSGDDINVSAVSLWEMRSKWQSFYRSGQRKGQADPEVIVGLLAQGDFKYVALPLVFAHCVAMLDAPLDHHDSFDRLLLAQAQVEGLRLLTRDAALEAHPLAITA